MQHYDFARCFAGTSSFLSHVEGRTKKGGCAEENISTGDGVSKKRPKKFNNKEIFCPPPEILVAIKLMMK